MRILVTGPNGFVGKHIMKSVPRAIPIASLRGNRNEVEARVCNADLIIHTAAISHMDDCERDPEASYKANVELPLWIAKAAPKAKLVFFSTDQVYNGLDGEEPFREETVCPINVYAKHKLEMEQRVLEMRPDAVMLRATWMFDLTWGFIPSIRDAQSPIIVNDAYRCVTSVEDVAQRILAAAELPGGSYNFGSENTYSMMELTAKTIEMLCQKKELQQGTKEKSLRIDCSKIKKAGIIFPDSLDGIRKCIETDRV